MSSENDKQQYQRLRALSPDDLWAQVQDFNRLDAPGRLQQVALIRAVAVVLSECPSDDRRAQARQWLAGLLSDPAEKVRRYAINALPKIGASSSEEQALLALWRQSTLPRERLALAAALGKIGGPATLAELSHAPGRDPSLAFAEQRVKATLARAGARSSIVLHRPFADFQQLRVGLRSRAGLETILRGELVKNGARQFRLLRVQSGLVLLQPLVPISLADLYRFRCFASLHFPIGEATALPEIAALITSKPALSILQTFTDGPIRYRLDFIDKGHQRAAVRELAQRVYDLSPALLNGGGDAPWTVEIQSHGGKFQVSLAPRIVPDPRFAYRQRDVPAASHPPLAASMARLAGPFPDEIAWDPFCGSGLELIERSLLGGVRRVIGTDRSPEAIQITEANFAAAITVPIEAAFTAADFRSFQPGPLSLIITNPPMGKRVPIPNLRLLIADLFALAARTLRPGGRLVFANPLPVSAADRSLRLAFHQVVDFGGFNCRLEKWVKQ